MKQVSRTDLINDFRRVAEELGKRPTLTEYNDHGEYSSTPIYKRFESFEALKEVAGFEKGNKRIDDETLIEDLQRVADTIGRTPPIEVYDKHGNHNSKTLKNRFGNWSEVLERAGMEPTSHSEHWEDNEPADFSEKYGGVEVECDYCGITTQKQQYQLERFENNYCSPECQYAVLTEQTGEDARSWSGGKATIECEVCGDIKKVKQAEKDKSRFCSQGCMLEWRSKAFTGDGHPRWNPDSEEVYYGPNWPEQRRRARERDTQECQVCGLGAERHKEKYGCIHGVHHIQKFKSFESYEEANKLPNLITLCHRCHPYVEHGKIGVPSAIWHRQKFGNVAFEGL